MLARRLVEQCTLAVLGRLDPVRLVCAFRGPSATDFRLGERNESSFSWARDVLPEFSVGGGAWSQASLKRGPVRGLLDGHLGNYIFEVAHPSALDALVERYRQAAEVPTWALDLQQFDAGGPLLGQIRARASVAYSTLSKGIHFEFLGVSNADLSSANLAAAIDSALFSIATVALYANVSGVSTFALSRSTAIRRYGEVAAYVDRHVKPHI